MERLNVKDITDEHDYLVNILEKAGVRFKWSSCMALAILTGRMGAKFGIPRVALMNLFDNAYRGVEDAKKDGD